MGAFVLDRQYRVLFWNKCIETWTGMKRDAICDKDIREFYPQITQSKITTRLDDIFTGGPPTMFSAQLHRFIIPAPLPGGNMRMQNTQVSAVLTDDGFRALFTLQDVTEINHRLEQYIAMRNHALNEVEERRKAEREIREREAMYRAIFEKMRAVKLIVDPESGAIVDVNTAGCYFYGYPYPQLLRLNIRHLNGMETRESAAALQLAANETKNIFEDRHRLASGEMRDVEIHSAPIELHGQTLLYQIILDVTERKNAERALRLSEIKFRNLFDLAADIIIVMDKNGIIQDGNQQIEKVLGYEKRDIKGIDSTELFASMPKETYAQYLCDIVNNDEVISFEAELNARDGSLVPVEVKARQLELDGEPAILSTARDITSRRKMDALREDVERITRHDLKNPLAAMLGLPDVLLQEPSALNEEQSKIVRVIRNASYTMLNMINLSFDLYKIETGTYTLKPSCVDILKILEKILFEVKDSLTSKRIIPSVRLFTQEKTEHVTAILGEELLSYSMLHNLVNNAIEASPRGEKLCIEITPCDKRLRITIHNQGAVPKDIQNHFFEKYVTSGKQGGTGLGTYSAKLMAEVQGGSIGFASSEETGTEVWVELPRP